MAEKGIVPSSVLIESGGQQLLQWLQDPSLEIISCVGWHGTGRWRFVEYATKIAMETQLFDVLIWLDLPADELKSHWKVQMRIAESLGIQSQTMNADEKIERETNVYIAVQIYEKLKDRKFLLIMGSATWKIEEHIDLAYLEGIGVHNLRRGLTSVSEVHSNNVVLVGDWMNAVVDVSLEFSVDCWRAEFWDLICEEVALAVHSPSTKGYFSPDIVMHFLSYFSLSFDDNYYSFLSVREWMTRYWIAEKLIDADLEKDEICAEKMGALFTELRDRSILLWDGNRLRIDIEKLNILRWGMDGRIPNSHPILWISEHSLPEEDDWGAIQRMSLLFTKTKAMNLPFYPNCPSLSTLFLRCELDYFAIPSTFFSHLNNLTILDLAGASIESLPSSLSSLCNLKLLTLQSCRKLAALPTSFRDLIKLEFLNLSGCHCLKVIPEKSFELMDKLQFLDLSETNIDSLPSSAFSKLHNLQQLSLRRCWALKSLPPSLLSNLVNLKKLNLSSCESLETGVSPQSLKSLTSLEELYLLNCKMLEDIRDASFQHILPKLRIVDISGTWTPNRLSFRGCQSIETLQLSSVQNLKVLDLSGTKLKQLDLTWWRDYSLWHLDILPTWYSDVLFEELHWGSDDDTGARIWVSDTQFFVSTLAFSAWFFDAPCFLRFYIRISPYEEGCMPMTIEEFQNLHMKRSTIVYEDICHSHSQAHLFSHFTSRSAFDRQLEICGGNSCVGGLGSVLAITQLITLLFNDIVETLSDLLDADAWKLRDLKECRIGSCQMMKNLFFEDTPNIHILRFLRVIWILDLPQLTAVCDGVYGAESFGFLRHIYIEQCPKLVTLFTSGVYLENLETLEIRFCHRLENVFQQEAVGRVGLLSLRRLRLFHVPKLKSVCNGHLHTLEEVHVNRCRKLRKLPIQVNINDLSCTSSSLPVVDIRGEMVWWENLQWDNNDDIEKSPACFRPWKHAPSTMKKMKKILPKKNQ